jgi:hypothetical protein
VVCGVVVSGVQQPENMRAQRLRTSRTYAYAYTTETEDCS